MFLNILLENTYIFTLRGGRCSDIDAEPVMDIHSCRLALAKLSSKASSYKGKWKIERGEGHISTRNQSNLPGGCYDSGRGTFTFNWDLTGQSLHSVTLKPVICKRGNVLNLHLKLMN